MGNGIPKNQRERPKEALDFGVHYPAALQIYGNKNKHLKGVPQEPKNRVFWAYYGLVKLAFNLKFKDDDYLFIFGNFPIVKEISNYISN